MVSTLDFDSNIPGSNPGRTIVDNNDSILLEVLSGKLNSGDI